MTKSKDSSDDAMSETSNSSEEEQVNDQINDEEDEEELEAVARTADSTDDDAGGDKASSPDNKAGDDQEEEENEEDESGVDNSGIGKREKARLKEMQKMKKQKIQEILTAQNAAIDADMVCFPIGFVLSRLCSISILGYVQFLFLGMRLLTLQMAEQQGEGRLKYLLQQTEIFAHFAKGDQSVSQKKSKGRYN
ncbi:chromatin-remodeling protein 11 [Actinidia rufa]|uniref:Chromatin-remodeling protein 11 n=1 Tax=Actinidia rufa TaxID=165716 RepID=A0A7J0EH51_9ERIC|nr:chromatin-remodeling protein 11 [Actinidia rufa]